jgi:hypothetical protein
LLNKVVVEIAGTDVPEEATMNRKLRWLRTTTIATTCALAALGAGCDTSTKDTTTTTYPTDPLNFEASDGDMDCIYTFSPGGSTGYPDFTLSYGVGGITVSASYSATYEGPPNSMQITYGDPAAPDFDSGVFTIFPADPGVTVMENSPTDWTMTFVGSPPGSEIMLPYGETWNLTFSCGAIPSCCADTTSVRVEADGSS